MAAKAGAAPAGGGSWADAAKRAGTGGTAAPTAHGGGLGKDTTGTGDKGELLDDEGFRLVTRRGGGGAARAAGGTDSRDKAQGPAQGVRADDGDTGADAHEGEGESSRPTVGDLQQAWHDEVAMVRRLRQQGVQGGHPALWAACEARDAAERAWRASKEPAPAAVRLGRAQAKLDRAVALQADARQAIVDTERAHKVRMAELQSAMDECTERVHLRRQQLREVQGEVAADGMGDTRAAAQRDVIHQVHSTICSEVGPTIAALVDQLDTATPAWAALNGLLGKLSSSRDLLESAGGGQPEAQQFDIADSSNHWESCSEWSESHELGEATGAGGGQDHAAHGGDQWGDGHGDGDGGHDQSMGTGDWWDGPQRRWKSGGTRWQACGHGQWARSDGNWADQLEEEEHGTGDDDLQPAPMRRRLDHDETGGSQGEGQQQSRTQQLRGDEDVGERRRQHEQRVSQIVSMAIDAGVTPLTSSGEELLLLDPPQLDAWVASHLPSALLC